MCVDSGASRPAYVYQLFLVLNFTYVRNNSVTKYEYKVANATRFSKSGYFVELCKLLFFSFNPHLSQYCCGRLSLLWAT